MNASYDKILIFTKQQGAMDWNLSDTVKIPYPKQMVSQNVKQQCKVKNLSLEELNECLLDHF